MTTKVPDSLLVSGGGGGGGGGTGDMLKSDNLSGLANLTTARSNLGLGSLATQSGTFSGTSSGTNTGDQSLTALMVKASNLSDLTNTTTARSNLGLGTLATQSGTFSGTSSGTNTGDQTLSDATISTSDITTNNATVAKHGFLPKLSGVAGQYLAADGTWATPPGGGGGGGDASGPASSTDNAVARFDTTTGKLLQNSTVLIGDTGNVTGLGTLNTHTIPGGTGTLALTSQITGTNSGTNTGDQDLSGLCVKSNNLSDVTASTARTNLGLGNTATKTTTFSTSAASGGADGDIWFTYTP